MLIVVGLQINILLSNQIESVVHTELILKDRAPNIF